MNKYLAQLENEEERKAINIENEFNFSLSKYTNKLNCLQLWNIEIQDTEEVQHQRKTEESEQINTELYNIRRKQAKKNNEASKPLIHNESVRSYFDFRKNQMKSNTK